jgi:hypothetical protein
MNPLGQWRKQLLPAVTSDNRSCWHRDIFKEPLGQRLKSWDGEITKALALYLYRLVVLSPKNDDPRAEEIVQECFEKFFREEREEATFNAWYSYLKRSENSRRQTVAWWIPEKLGGVSEIGPEAKFLSTAENTDPPKCQGLAANDRKRTNFPKWPAILLRPVIIGKCSEVGDTGFNQVMLSRR